MAKNRGRKPAPGIPPFSPQWRTWMPALGAGYGLVSFVPSSASCSNWPLWYSSVVLFGSPALFTLLELISYVVKARMNRRSLAESQMAKLMWEVRSDQATLQALLAMLGAAIAGADSNYAPRRGGDSGISARPVGGKPRPSRSRPSPGERDP
jgi:hypothetical protein